MGEVPGAAGTGAPASDLFEELPELKNLGVWGPD